VAASHSDHGTPKEIVPGIPQSQPIHLVKSKSLSLPGFIQIITGLNNVVLYACEILKEVLTKKLNMATWCIAVPTNI
jgi:hypothetical protein